MFIENIMAKIWEPVSIEFKSIYDEALGMNTEKLYNLIVSDIKREDNVYYKSKELSITGLTTKGCPHNNRNGKFSGCSMCDYISNNIDTMAKMSALKKKSLELYLDVIYESFKKSRGNNPEPSEIELLTAHDFLNGEEIPDEILLYGLKGEFFKSKPKNRFVFETRATSVTAEKLNKWKEKLGEKVSVELGIEVGNEWIRNHWINKNTTNDDIIKAITLIHRTGWGTGANILIGIPGLTENQSIELFKETFLWMCDMDVGYILCSPIILKKRTLQEYIYDNLKNNLELQEQGIVNGEHTGVPTIFTVFECIYSVITTRPDAAEKIRLSPIYFPPYFEVVKKINKNTSNEKIVNYLADVLWDYSINKNYNVLKEAKEVLEKDKNYCEYKCTLNSQNNCDNILDTISVLGEEISKCMHGVNWKENFDILESELKTYAKDVIGV